MPTSLLVLGGARSGKSSFAAAWIRALPGPRTYLATCRHEPDDPEMVARIAQHRAQRDSDNWVTVEEPLSIAHVIRMSSLGPVLIDCATLWLTNLGFAHDWNAEVILRRVDELCELLVDPPVEVAVVSNEVGQGVVPETPLGRTFRDLHGFTNQRLAKACHRVELLVAGLPLTLKPSTHKSLIHGSSSHGLSSHGPSPLTPWP